MVTTRGDSYTFLFTDCFNRRADMYAIIAAEDTAEVLANKCIPLWGFTSILLSNNSSQFCAGLAQVVYALLRVHKEVSTSSFNPNSSIATQGVNHTMS